MVVVVVLRVRVVVVVVVLVLVDRVAVRIAVGHIIRLVVLAAVVIVAPPIVLVVPVVVVVVWRRARVRAWMACGRGWLCLRGRVGCGKNDGRQGGLWHAVCAPSWPWRWW